ncbi:MAG: hypothetical protein ACI87E_004802 [Mariniblastus sp.]|jgi:hypothetical protein
MRNGNSQRDLTMSKKLAKRITNGIMKTTYANAVPGIAKPKKEEI